MDVRFDGVQLVIQPHSAHRFRCALRKVYAKDSITLFIGGSAVNTHIDVYLFPV